MDVLYTYLGYTVIVILFYLIYITLFPSTASESFMGFGADSASDSKSKLGNKNSNNGKNGKNSNNGKNGKNSDNNKNGGKSREDKSTMDGLQKMIDDLNAKSLQTVEQYSLARDRKQWEDLIIAIEDRINSITLVALPTLAVKISTKPDDAAIEKMIEKMNTLNGFRATLAENMKYLNGLE